MKIISNKPKKVVTAPVEKVVEAKPQATKKHAARKPKEITPEVVSSLLFEEPEIAEISDDIKEILANSEV